MKYISSTFVTAVTALDRKCRQIRTYEKWRQVLVIAALGVAVGMEDYVNLFWLSTRSEVSVWVYITGLLLSLCAEYTKTVLKMRV